jgi:hypothetical protein
VQGAVNALADIGMFFAACGKQGKFLVPVAHAYPFMTMMGKALSGWFLLWEAGVAAERLEALGNGGREEAFYKGKIAGARYFARNVLPEVDAVVKAIKSEDLSIMEIPDEGFAF